jgi:uncharacterized LabA/DUF88 family protein
MTVIKHKEQRVGIFIDTQNLYHSAKNLYNGSRVNFGAIMKEVVAGRSLIRAIAYVITTESGEEKNFFEALSKLGIEAKTKNIQIFNSGAKKADWDVGLAVDAIKLAPKLDTVIIASGDGDFIPLVEYLQTNEGCQVEVIAFGKSKVQQAGSAGSLPDSRRANRRNVRSSPLGRRNGARPRCHQAHAGLLCRNVYAVRHALL